MADQVTAVEGAAARPTSWAAALRRGALALTGIVGAAALWEVVGRTGIVNPVYLPPPSLILPRIPVLLREGTLYQDVVTSLSAILYGVVLGHLVGVPAAVVAFRYPWVRSVISPVIELIRGIAPLALLPAFLLLFGLGLVSAVAIIVWCAWVPLFLNLLEGLDAVDPALVRSARATGARSWKIATSVYAPASVGHYLTGLRLAIGAGWLAVVAAEMLGSNSGLGFRIFEFSQVFRIVDMYALILIIGVIGLLMNAAVTVVRHRVLHWRSA